jgi:hypothetical protein
VIPKYDSKWSLDTKVEFEKSLRLKEMETEVFDGKVKVEMGEAESLELSKYFEVALVARY